jgi:hypothetical protein
MTNSYAEKAKQLGMAGLRWTTNRTEGRITAAGAGVGVLTGICVGGMGLAVGGTAVALSGPIVIGVGMALIANRVGVAVERRADAKRAAFIGPMQPGRLQPRTG